VFLTTTDNFCFFDFLGEFDRKLKILARKILAVQLEYKNASQLYAACKSFFLDAEKKYSAD
jgi:hypothetical protein